MVHESVLDAIHEDFDSDYEGGEYDDEEDGELQSDFKAMDIARDEGNPRLGGQLSLGDAAEARIPEFEPGKSNSKRKKKKKRKGQGNQGAPNRRRQPVSIEQFVVYTCRRIGETKYPLFREAVDRIGIDAVKSLLNQVDVIEKCGGQMTADGGRRRSGGGVLWSLLRDHVGPDLYKEIMKEGNRKHIEQQKAKLKEKENEGGNGKRQHVEVEGDERRSFKRFRTSVDVDGPPPRGRSVSRERLPRATLREEVDNVRTPAALQNSWVQGLKRHSDRGENVLNPKPLEDNGPDPKPSHRPVSERIRMTVSYGDLVDTTDSPIHGVTELGFEEEDCYGQMNDELQEKEEMKEEGEIAD